MLKIKLLASLIAFSALLTTSVSAKQPDHGCYMKTSSGRVINLSRTVCQFDLSEALAKQDAAYLAAAKKMIGRHAEPWLTDMLNNNPGVFTAAAREYCQARQSGVSEQQYMDQKFQTVVGSEPKTREDYERHHREMQVKIVPASLAMSLATQHYCPQVANRRSFR